MESNVNWSEIYAEVRNRAPELFRQAVESSGTIKENHGLSLKVAAAIEQAMMSLLKRCLDGWRD